MSTVHDQVQNLPERGGQLLVNGRALGEVVLSAGGAPLYIYDRTRIASRVRELRRLLPESIKLHYALKANPMPALACYMEPLVDGFDVASGGELLAALNTGIDPRNISFAGPGKSVEELRAAAAAGVVVAVESEVELQRLHDIAGEFAMCVPIIVRLNPKFQLKRSGLAMTGYASQFGIDADRVADVLASTHSSRVDVLGFQVFAGSQNLRAEALIECQRQTIELAHALAPLVPGGIRHLNIGGGFGIPYFAGEQALDIEPIGAGLAALEREYPELFANADVVIELGRYLVGEAGFYVTQVTDIKMSRDKKFAIVNGGMNHHLANSGNLGQVIRKNYPIAVGNKMGEQKTEVVTITGPLCTPLDIVADEVELPILEIGDLIVVFQSGAYGYSASPHQFLSRAAPSEILA